MSSALDNVIWHAITGPHRSLANVEGRAGRFEQDVSPFSAVDDISSPEAWDDLAHLVGPGKTAVLFAPVVGVPGRWTMQHRMPCYQFVATNVRDRADTDGLIELTSEDVPEMIDLVATTRPGPFDKRTIELGRYVGVRDGEGRLVAMTGERFRTPGFTEVSAVCTADEVRGTGLGRKLVLAVVEGIRARGDEAFLHVLTDNTPAVSLYESLGFTVRCEAEAVIVRAPEA